MRHRLRLPAARGQRQQAAQRYASLPPETEETEEKPSDAAPVEADATEEKATEKEKEGAAAVAAPPPVVVEHPYVKLLFELAGGLDATSTRRLSSSELLHTLAAKGRPCTLAAA